MCPIRVLIADDQELVRAGLRRSLNSEPDITVVSEAPDGEQAVYAARLNQPDVILMDVRMPHLDGISACEQILSSGIPTRVIMLTTFDLDEYIFKALDVGASGFLLKDAPLSEVIDAVRTVASGEGLIAPRVTTRVIAEFARRPAPEGPGGDAAMPDLTARERAVLRLVARGLSNAEIGEELSLSVSTVKSHIRSTLRKLELRDRTQLVIAAYESGFAKPGESLAWPSAND